MVCHGRTPTSSPSARRHPCFRYTVACHQAIVELWHWGSILPTRCRSPSPLSCPGRPWADGAGGRERHTTGTLTLRTRRTRERRSSARPLLLAPRSCSIAIYTDGGTTSQPRAY